MVWYCTREQVKSALDMRETARNNAVIDRTIEAVSREIEAPGALNRVFAPTVETRYFDWPDYTRTGQSPTRIDIDGSRPLISISALSAGGVTISATDYFLRPDTGPPFTHIEIDLASSAAFASGDTWQRAISATVLSGYSNSTTPAGTLATTVNTSITAVITSATAAVGVGSVLVCESERMLVTGRTHVSSGYGLGVALTASAADAVVAVSDGTAFAVGEQLLVDSERMLITDIAANSLIVIRAFDGSTLATHAIAAAIYAPRSLIVTRAALGTTAAAHTSPVALAVWDVPGPVNELTIAETVVRLQQKSSAFARTIGAGENERAAPGRDLAEIRKSARRAVGYRELYRGGI